LGILLLCNVFILHCDGFGVVLERENKQDIRSEKNEGEGKTLRGFYEEKKPFLRFLRRRRPYYVYKIFYDFL
jgi:hypothetical protein